MPSSRNAIGIRSLSRGAARAGLRAIQTRGRRPVRRTRSFLSSEPLWLTSRAPERPIPKGAGQDRGLPGATSVAVRLRLPPTRVSGLRPSGAVVVHAASASRCEAPEALRRDPPDDEPGGQSDARRDHALDPTPAWRGPCGSSDHKEAWAQSAWSDRDDARRAPTPTSGTETRMGQHTASDRFDLKAGMIGRRCRGVIVNARCGNVPSIE